MRSKHQHTERRAWTFTRELHVGSFSALIARVRIYNLLWRLSRMHFFVNGLQGYAKIASENTVNSKVTNKVFVFCSFIEKI
jgi:hypothetical protein